MNAETRRLIEELLERLEAATERVEEFLGAAEREDDAEINAAHQTMQKARTALSAKARS